MFEKIEIDMDADGEDVKRLVELEYASKLSEASYSVWKEQVVDNPLNVALGNALINEAILKAVSVAIEELKC